MGRFHPSLPAGDPDFVEARGRDVCRQTEETEEIIGLRYGSNPRIALEENDR